MFVFEIFLIDSTPHHGPQARILCGDDHHWRQLPINRPPHAFNESLYHVGTWSNGGTGLNNQLHLASESGQVVLICNDFLPAYTNNTGVGRHQPIHGYGNSMKQVRFRIVMGDGSLGPMSFEQKGAMALEMAFKLVANKLPQQVAEMFTPPQVYVAAPAFALFLWANPGKVIAFLRAVLAGVAVLHQISAYARDIWTFTTKCNAAATVRDLEAAAPILADVLARLAVDIGMVALCKVVGALVKGRGHCQAKIAAGEVSESALARTAKAAGMEIPHLKNLLKFCSGEPPRLAIFRGTNRASLRWHGDPMGLPKPLEVKLKTGKVGTTAGKVVKPSAAELAAKPKLKKNMDDLLAKGYRFDEQGVLRDPHGRFFYGDHDQFAIYEFHNGVFRPLTSSRGNDDPRIADWLNRVIFSGRPMIQHGRQASILKGSRDPAISGHLGNGKPAVRPLSKIQPHTVDYDPVAQTARRPIPIEPGETFLVAQPDGTAVMMNERELRLLYQRLRITWPYTADD